MEVQNNMPIRIQFPEFIFSKIIIILMRIEALLELEKENEIY